MTTENSEGTNTPSAAAVACTDWLADLEHRMDAAWADYMAAFEKATRDREAIDATVYRVHGKWCALYSELKQAKSANAKVSSGDKP